MINFWGHSGRISEKAGNAALFFGQKILDFIFPPLCVLCDSTVYSGNRLLCENCRRKLPGISKPLLSAEELIHPPDPPIWFDKTLALFEYNSDVQKLIHLCKYKNMPKFSLYFGELLGQAILQQPELNDVDMLVPVPLHISRYRERGYNQSAELAKTISKIMGAPVYKNILKRTNYTPPQAGLKREERVKNLLGAFTVKDSTKIKDSCVAVVDDVMTTGTTVNECARVLRAAGAKRVVILSVTRIE
ncbi:ComF family protein [candidate division KSB1 bacterium]|nr:ComF family protein [candidate division KSB1 bacterium]